MNSPHLSRFPNYNRFDPPMALDFANWTRREARSYFDWFIDHIPERMNELRRFARFAMPDCDLDGLPDSLRCLGKLLIEHVATRPRTAKERG